MRIPPAAPPAAVAPPRMTWLGLRVLMMRGKLDCAGGVPPTPPRRKSVKGPAEAAATKAKMRTKAIVNFIVTLIS